MFSSSDECREELTLLGPFEKAAFKHWDPTEQVSTSLIIKKERDPISETSCFLVIQKK
jgi:hypothetical protein